MIDLLPGCPDDCTNDASGNCPACFEEHGQGCPHGPLCRSCSLDLMYPDHVAIMPIWCLSKLPDQESQAARLALRDALHFLTVDYDDRWFAKKLTGLGNIAATERRIQEESQSHV